jgi:hypothetical protein
MTMSTPRRRPRLQPARLLAVTIALGAIILALPSLVAADPGTSLTGHWTFDKGSGTTAADSSGQNNPLTLEGGASWGPGVVGPHALSLNGDGQYAQSSGR